MKSLTIDEYYLVKDSDMGWGTFCEPDQIDSVDPERIIRYVKVVAIPSGAGHLTVIDREYVNGVAQPAMYYVEHRLGWDA